MNVFLECVIIHLPLQLYAATSECGGITGELPPLPFQKGANRAEVDCRNRIIGNFMVDQDRLETNLLQLFSYLEILTGFL